MEIWTEKYRPKTLDEVVGQDEIVEKLKAFVKRKNMPHLLFAGPAGTGKTTCALALARELYGDKWRENLLELNASDERGIDVIRTKVKDFARTKPIGNVPFKIILLDEADSLTRDAQHALRRTMENYTSTCRFILDCNYSSRIIPPIQSRSAVFRFKPISFEDAMKYLERIVKGEKLKLDKKAKEALYEVSEGDLRRLTNILQSCAAVSKKIDEDLVYSVAGVARPKEIEDIILLAMKGNMDKARELALKVMLGYGLSGVDMLKLMNKRVWKLELPMEKKIQIIDRIGEFEFRMVEGADEFLQLQALLAYLAYVGK